MITDSDPENAAIIMGIALLFIISILWGCKPSYGSTQSCILGVHIEGIPAKDILVVNDDGSQYIEHWYNQSTREVLTIERL